MADALVQLAVNGEPRKAVVEPRLTLADFLREVCHLTGYQGIVAAVRLAARARARAGAGAGE
jgi:aerobic-type carbon monoxide dehydrogenase small subunit (CoxS/CutS family)